MLYAVCCRSVSESAVPKSENARDQKGILGKENQSSQEKSNCRFQIYVCIFWCGYITYVLLMSGLVLWNNLHSDVLTTNCIIGKHLLTNDSEKTEQTSIVVCIEMIASTGRRVKLYP